MISDRLSAAAGAAALAVTLGGADPAFGSVDWIGERRLSWQLSIGQMTDNEWGDLFVDWGSVRFRDATAFGAGGQLEWPVWRIGYVGIEVQALIWVGEQNHVEFTVPAYIRTPRPQQVWLPALSYGLGLSYATEPSESEIARTGESTELLAHWFFELEFGNSDTRLRPYLRLHHRSDNNGMFDADTGSNALMLGLRQSF